MSKICHRQSKHLTQFQKEIHVPSIDDSGISMNETISSLCYQDYTKCHWYSQVLLKMASSVTNKESSSESENERDTAFIPDMSFHYITRIVCRRELPMIRVKAKYAKTRRIRWPHNIAFAPIQRFSINQKGGSIFTADYEVFNLQPQFFSGKTGVDSNNMALGNLECFEQWTTVLPRGEVIFDMPAPCNGNPANGFPLWRYEDADNLKFILTENLHLHSNLCMQKLVKKDGVDTWVDTAVSHNMLEEPPKKLPAAELSAEYIFVSEAELDEKRRKGDYVYYYKDFVHFSSTNPEVAGKIVKVNFETTSPVESVYWMAERIESSKFNGLANYSTNAGDIYTGGNPIKLNSLKYGDEPLFEKMPSSYFTIADPRAHADSVPYEPGYHMYSMASSPHSHGPDVGIVFKPNQGELSVLLAPSCYLAQDDLNRLTNELQAGDDDDDNLLSTLTYRGNDREQETYTLHVIVRITRRIVFGSDHTANGETVYRKTLE